jgi:hypothetical protein
MYGVLGMGLGMAGIYENHINEVSNFCHTT